MKRIKQESENLFEFCPGNATRYRIYAAHMNPLRVGPFNLIVAWLSENDMGGPAMLMSTFEEMSVGYFMEKTGIKKYHDAVAIMCFMREQFDAKIHIGLYEDLPWVISGKPEAVPV